MCPTAEPSRAQSRLPNGPAGYFAVPVKVRWTLCGLQFGLIALLSLLPAWLMPPAPARVPGIDKFVHLAMYAVLGVLLRWAAEERPSRIAGWGWPLAGAGYGLLMETCQLWLAAGGRSFSWADAAANLLGVVAAWRVAGWGFKRRATRPR